MSKTAHLWEDPQAVLSSIRVEINAPASLVWDILLDMPSYPDWNPFCVECSSSLEMGAPVNMKLKSYTEPDTFFDNCEYICAIVPRKQISWELPDDEAWPYPARRDQFIEELGDNKCMYWSTDAFLGDNGIHVMRFAGSWVKQAFDDTARALKAHAEALNKAGSV